MMYAFFWVVSRAGHVVRLGEERVVYRVLVGKPGGKETTGERSGGMEKYNYRIFIGVIEFVDIVGGKEAEGV